MKPSIVLALLSSLLLFSACVTTPPPPAPTSAGQVSDAPAATSLADTSWALVRLQDQALVLPPNAHRPFLVFNAEGRVFGFSGVNRFSGPAKIDGDAVSFGPLAATRMAGPSIAMAMESRLFESLRLATAWRVRDDHLELLADQTVVAIFKSIPPGETE